MHSYLRMSAIGRPTILLMVLCGAGTVPLCAQSTKDSATDLHYHKFQPAVPPEQAIPPSATSGQSVNGMSAFAAQQIQALQRDKMPRTPAQVKMDSTLLYTIRMLAGQPAAPGVTSLYTGVDLDENNNV